MLTVIAQIKYSILYCTVLYMSINIFTKLMTVL